MDHNESSGLDRRWNSLSEELDALRDNPRAQALLRDLETQGPDRVDLLLDDLETQAETEGRTQ